MTMTIMTLLTNTLGLRQPNKSLMFGLVLATLCQSVGLVLPAHAVDHYLLKRAHDGMVLGMVSVNTVAIDANQTETVVTNTHRFKREGELFEVASTAHYRDGVEASVINNASPQFAFRFSMGQDIPSEVKGIIDKQRHRIEVLDSAWVPSNKTPQQTSDKQIATLMTVANVPSVNKTSTDVVSDVSQQFVFPAGPSLEALFNTHFNDESNASFIYETIEPGLKPVLITTRVTPTDEYQNVPDESNPSLQKRVRLFRLQNVSNPNNVVEEWRDTKGHLYQADYDALDMQLVYASSLQVKQYNEQASTVPDLFLDNDVSVLSIPFPRHIYKAEYHLFPLKGKQINLSSYFKPSAGQQIKLISAYGTQGLMVSVTQPTPENTAITYPTLYDSRYLKANDYINPSNSKMVRQIKSIVGPERRSYYAVKKLHQWVYKNIVNKSLSMGFASSDQVFASREGDCTEHAVLLAAMTRSLGIPSRVAVGLAYFDDPSSPELGRFRYHMWTEVYIGDSKSGTWLPVDASMPEFAMDATHLKIADSSLANSADVSMLSQKVVPVLGKIRMEVAEAVSTRQSTITFKKPADNALKINGSKGQYTQGGIQHLDIANSPKANIPAFRVNPLPSHLSMESPEGQLAFIADVLNQGQYDKANAQASVLIQSTQSSQNSAQKLMDLGHRFAVLGLYNEAYDAYQKAVHANGSFSSEVNHTIAEFFPAERLSQSNAKTYFEAVGGLRKPATYDDAMMDLETFVQDNPRYAPVYLVLADQALNKGNTQEALDYFSQYDNVMPRDPKGMQRAGEVMLSQGDFQQAAQIYQQALDKAQGLQSSNAPQIQNTLAAKLNVARGKTRVIQNNKDASGWQELGVGLQNDDDSLLAINAYKNSLTLNPNNEDVLIKAFRLMLDANHWQDLNTYYPSLVKQYQRKSPRFTDIARLKGEYELHTRDYQQAEKTLLESKDADTSNAQTYLLLSDLYERLASQNKFRIKNSYATLNGASQSGWLSKAKASVGMGLHNVSDRKAQKRLATRQAELVVEDEPETVLQLANMYVSSPLSRDDVDLALSKARAEILLGQSDQAIQTLTQVLAVSRQDIKALTLLAEAYQSADNPAKALTYYQRALKVQSDEPELVAKYSEFLDVYSIPEKHPPQKLVMTDDERDFFVQHWLQQAILLKENTVFLNQFLKYTDNLGQLTVAGNAERANMVAFLDRRYIEQEQRYKTLKKTMVPPRYKRYHTSLLNDAYYQLMVSRLLKQVYGYRTSMSEQTRFAPYESKLVEVINKQVVNALGAFAELDKLKLYYPQNTFQILQTQADYEKVELALIENLDVRRNFYKTLASRLSDDQREVFEAKLEEVREGMPAWAKQRAQDVMGASKQSQK